MAIEGMGLGKVAEIAEELEASGFVSRDQLLQEQPAEQPGKHAHWQEEAGPARHPALAIGRQSATRHDAMDMG